MIRLFLVLLTTMTATSCDSSRGKTFIWRHLANENISGVKGDEVQVQNKTPVFSGTSAEFEIKIIEREGDSKLGLSLFTEARRSIDNQIAPYDAPYPGMVSSRLSCPAGHQYERTEALSPVVNRWALFVHTSERKTLAECEPATQHYLMAQAIVACIADNRVYEIKIYERAQSFERLKKLVAGFTCQ